MDSHSMGGQSGQGHDRELVPGDVVGKFVIDKKIGEGGFGTVYRAQNDIDKIGAVKVLHYRYSADPDMVSRFKAEARAVNQIRHHNIIDIFEFGSLPDGRQYYIMEYLDGLPMDELLAHNGRLSLADALPILRGIARALDAAHKNGIAHRDLKPENVFLVRSEGGGYSPRLLDFGIAKLLHDEGGAGMHKTRTGAPIGTPTYMSPEQCRGREVDHRTDLYAFGCLLYQIVTGQVPFDGADVMDILLAQIQQPAPVPSQTVPGVPSNVDRAVAWLMEKEPKNRPPTLSTIISILEESALPPTPQTGHPTSTVAPRATGPVDSFEATEPRRTRWPWWVGGAAVVGAVAFALFGGKPQPTVSPVPARAATVVPAKPAEKKAVELAAPAPLALSFIDLTIEGVPEGTEVFWPGGLLGVAPGTLRVPYGTQAFTLTLRHDGYQPLTRSFVPNGNALLSLTLQKKSAPPKNPRKRNDLENPFGGN